MKKLRFGRLLGFYSDEVTEGGRARSAASRSHTGGWGPGTGDPRTQRTSSQEKGPSGAAWAREGLSAVLQRQSFQHHPLPLFSLPLPLS